jgi:hypothetical protein
VTQVSSFGAPVSEIDERRRNELPSVLSQLGNVIMIKRPLRS